MWLSDSVQLFAQDPLVGGIIQPQSASRQSLQMIEPILNDETTT
jgi:hypothetical protein